MNRKFVQLYCDVPVERNFSLNDYYSLKSDYSICWKVRSLDDIIDTIYNKTGAMIDKNQLLLKLSEKKCIKIDDKFNIINILIDKSHTKIDNLKLKCGHEMQMKVFDCIEEILEENHLIEKQHNIHIEVINGIIIDDMIPF